MIELRTLGALELMSAAGTPLGAVLAQPRRTALLCYLALGSPSGFSGRDVLYALFWPEHDAQQARRALRQALYFLRRALGATAIVSRGDGALAVATDQIRCDAREFERRLGAGQPEAALTLYRGDLLAGFHVSDAPAFERWLDEERARLRRRAAEAAWAAADARARAGDPSAAAEWGRRAAGFSPTDETEFRRLVLLLDRLGDRAAAVRAYESFARTLRDEYELEPSAATRELVARVRAGERATMTAGSRVRSGPEHAAVVEGSSVLEQADEPRATAPDADVPELRGGRDDGARRAGAPAAPPSAAVPADWRPRPLVTAVAASLLTVLLLGVAGWRLAAGTRRAPMPAARELVLVADFANRTQDSTYGELVAYVLGAELARSPLLGVVGRTTIADALQRMRAPPGTRLTGDVAREVAVREEIKAVVEGEIRVVARGLVVSAMVVDAASGDVLHGASATARDSTQILAAIAHLADGIRRGIGESLASIEATDSLWRFTTSSLPALRKQVAAIEARGRGDYLRAVELLEEAVALDSGFAYAYASLANQRRIAGLPPGRAVPGLVHAYELRHRLTERERYAIEGQYHLNVTGDLPKAVSALQKHAATPQCIRGEACMFSTLGETLALSGDLAAAMHFLGQRHVPGAHSAHLVRAVLGSLPAQLVRVRVLYASGDGAEARRVLDELSRRDPEQPGVLRAQVGLLAASGRYDEAHALAAHLRRGSGVHNDLYAQALLDALRGRYGEAVNHLRELRDQMLALGELPSAVEIAAAAGRLRLHGGDARGTAEVEDLLAQHRLDAVALDSRPYLALALLYAEAGRPRSARGWLDAYARAVPREYQGPDRWLLHRARASVSRLEGRAEAAVAELQQAARSPPVQVGLFDDPAILIDDHPELARAYAASGAADSAIAVYERYLAVRSLHRAATDAVELGRALERLGVLYAQRGDTARAAAHARRLAALWHDGDAALQARAAAAQRRAAALNPPLAATRE